MKMKILTLTLLSSLMVMKIEGTDDTKDITSTTPKKLTLKETLALKRQAQLGSQPTPSLESTSSLASSLLGSGDLSSSKLLSSSMVSGESEAKDKELSQLKFRVTQLESEIQFGEEAFNRLKEDGVYKEQEIEARQKEIKDLKQKLQLAEKEIEVKQEKILELERDLLSATSSRGTPSLPLTPLPLIPSSGMIPMSPSKGVTSALASLKKEVEELTLAKGKLHDLIILNAQELSEAQDDIADLQKKIKRAAEDLNDEKEIARIAGEDLDAQKEIARKALEEKKSIIVQAKQKIAEAQKLHSEEILRLKSTIPSSSDDALKLSDALRGKGDAELQIEKLIEKRKEEILKQEEVDVKNKEFFERLKKELEDANRQGGDLTLKLEAATKDLEVLELAKIEAEKLSVPKIQHEQLELEFQVASQKVIDLTEFLRLETENTKNLTEKLRVLTEEHDLLDTQSKAAAKVHGEELDRLKEHHKVATENAQKELERQVKEAEEKAIKQRDLKWNSTYNADLELEVKQQLQAREEQIKKEKELDVLREQKVVETFEQKLKEAEEKARLQELEVKNAGQKLIEAEQKAILREQEVVEELKAATLRERKAMTRGLIDLLTPLTALYTADAMASRAETLATIDGQKIMASQTGKEVDAIAVQFDLSTLLEQLFPDLDLTEEANMTAVLDTVL